ncbi:MAG: hypothetical protein IT561_12655 [Alphaproteobacteria bacterium]|nr:hypothetical protein [Alphaproteobacteria bacterium]
MIGRRGLIAGAGAAVALGYLGAMVANGARPVQRQHVRSEANGVLTIPPERILRVELRRDDETLALRRDGEGRWLRPDGTTIDTAAGRRIGTAIQMMHRSGPVREMTAAELAGVDTTPFALERPRIVATLWAEGDAPALTARFGGRNPEDFLQYMRIDGDPRLFLMSRFIGEEWVGAMDALTGR